MGYFLIYLKLTIAVACLVANDYIGYEGVDLLWDKIEAKYFREEATTKGEILKRTYAGAAFRTLVYLGLVAFTLFAFLVCFATLFNL